MGCRVGGVNWLAADSYESDNFREALPTQVQFEEFCGLHFYERNVKAYEGAC